MLYVVLAVLAAAVIFAIWPFLRPVAAKNLTALSSARTSQGVPPSADVASQPVSQASGEKPAPEATKPLPRKETNPRLAAFLLGMVGVYVVAVLILQPSLPATLGSSGCVVMVLWGIQRFCHGYILRQDIERVTRALGVWTTLTVLAIVSLLLLNQYWPGWSEDARERWQILREKVWPARAELVIAGPPERPALAPAAPSTPAAPPESAQRGPVRRSDESGRAAAQDAKAAKPPVAEPEKLPSLPIRVTELEPGRVWRFEIRGPTDIRAVAAHVRAASSATVRLTSGKTYRFLSPSVPRGRVHVTTRYLPSSQSTVKDAEVPGEELPYGLAKIFPQHDMVTTIWQEGSGVGPIAVVIEETGESQKVATARLARMVDSQPVVP